MNVKQVIVIRKELGLRCGKWIAQAGHGFSYWLFDRLRPSPHKPGEFTIEISPIEYEWINSGHTKICVYVDSEKELIDIYNKAKEAGITSFLVKDMAKTELKEPTFTCCCLGPAPAEKIDLITRHLKIY